MDGRTDGRADTQKFGGYNIIPRHFLWRGIKTARGVAETRLTTEKLLKGHYSDKNQLSMTSIKYDHLQVIWQQYLESLIKIPLKTVGGVVETRTSVDKMAKTDKGP